MNKEAGETGRRLVRRGWRPLRYAIALMASLAAILSAAPARGGTVIAVTPTRIPMRLAPGDTGSGAVELINQGDEAASLLPGVAAVTVDGTGAAVFSRDERCAWVSLDRNEIDLAPAAREAFTFAVNVPGTAAPGAYRLALSFEPAREGDGGVGFAGGVAVLVELEVSAAKEGAGESGNGAAKGIAAAAAAFAALAAATTAFLLVRARGKREAGEGAEGGEAR